MYSDYTSSDDDYNINNEDSYNDNNNEQKNKYKKWIFIGLIILSIVLLVLVIIKYSFENRNNTKLYIVDSNLYLKQGESQKIDINIPNSKDNYIVTWSTSNNNVIVDENGVVYADAPGEVIITATGSDGKTANCTVIVEEIPIQIIEVESISLDITELELVVGETYQFNIDINPTNAELIDEITWESSNLDILKINNDTVTALKPGKSIVTVKTKNGLTATCNVTVKEEENIIEEQTEIFPEKIQLNIKSQILNIGDTLELSVFFEPEDVTNKDIIWNSSDSEVASIENGTLHALKNGIAIITAKTINDKMSSCTIVVNGTNKTTSNEITKQTQSETKIEYELNEIKLSSNSLTLNVGEKTKLNVQVVPSLVDSKYLNFTWSSSNSKVASVDSNGNINALSSGKTIITIKSINDVKTTCEVTVMKIDIKTFEQRNDAVVYYDNLTKKDIKAVDKKFNCKIDVKSGYNNCDMPKVYETSLTGNIKIYQFDEKNYSKTYIKTTTNKLLPYNLIPNIVYYLESESNPNNNEFIKIIGNLRMIKVTDIRNIRDLGGYQADNGIIRYGKLFRGANPNYVKDQETTTNIFTDLGIKVIFDLRESSSWKKQKNILSSFEKMNSDTGYYLSSKKYANTRTSVEKIMKQIVQNKGVYFHCAVGTDRTGTVGNLLEGILGVPLEIRLNDYELSYFYKHYSSTNRNASSIKRVYTKVSSFGGSNDQEKYINWFLSDSKNLESDIKLINDFRKSMINGNPTMYKVENKKCVAI